VFQQTPSNNKVIGSTLPRRHPMQDVEFCPTQHLVVVLHNQFWNHNAWSVLRPAILTLRSTEEPGLWSMRWFEHAPLYHTPQWQQLWLHNGKIVLGFLIKSSAVMLCYIGVRGYTPILNLLPIFSLLMRAHSVWSCRPWLPCNDNRGNLKDQRLD